MKATVMKQQVLLERECEDQFILSSLPSLRWNVDEGPYTARLLAEGDKELMLCWRLRYRYFVEQRGWVAPDPCHPQLEYDGYDPFAWHLAVFEAEEIVAYLRVLPWRPEVGFMLETEFSSLLSPSTGRALPRIGAVELSRLVCCPQTAAKGEQGSPHALELLLKLLYHLALSQGIEQFHIVVESAWLKPFVRRFGLPFTPLGEVQVLAGGTRTVAATATLDDLQSAIRRRWPDKYAWYHQTREAAPDEDSTNAERFDSEP